MYWPSTSSDGEFLFREVDGEALDPDEVLSKYTDWHNTAEWPVSKRQQSVVQRDIKKQADPLEKPGTVGAFCRTYSVADAIDTFIPDVYKHSAMPGRYDYIPADSQAGVVLYEDKFAYSHHATDPACGKLMNAFDVVRIHKFGALDARADVDTDPAKLPSFKAMQEFAVQDERVKMQLAKERVGLAQAEFAEELDEENWQTILELDKTGKVKDTLNNIANIIRYDPNLKPIVYNEFKSTIDVWMNSRGSRSSRAGLMQTLPMPNCTLKECMESGHRPNSKMLCWLLFPQRDCTTRLKNIFLLSSGMVWSVWIPCWWITWVRRFALCESSNQKGSDGCGCQNLRTWHQV